MIMREIKFMAWDGSRMLWRGLFDRNWYNGDKSAQCIKGIHPSDEKSLIVMQFTGLKDANGVDIYEGDVVHWGHIAPHTEIHPRKAVVEFSPEIAFRTFNLRINHRFGLSNFAYRKVTHTAMEIIGNIHQNPELL